MNCLLVRDANSRARISPKMDTAKAASLSRGGMDITGVFRGRVFERMTKPAMILPATSRFMGLTIAGSFSLMGDKELNRGWPIDTKKTTRRL